MRRLWILSLTAACAAACSSPGETTNRVKAANGGMGNGASTPSGSGGRSLGSGGAPAAGGKGAALGGSVSSLSSGGAASGVVGSTDGASGGAAAALGGASSGGATGASGGTGSAAGGTANSDVASALQGQRWEAPCGTHSDDECENFPPGTTSCPANGYTMVDRMITFGGTVGTSYNVTLRFRGVLEPKVYTGGTAAGGHLYIGGTAPESNYNVYSLEVSSPPATLFFNSDEGQGEGHYVFAIDETTTVRIDAGASVRLFARDSNCILLANCDRDQGCGNTPYVIPGVPPANGFDGQFVQMDVVSVSVAN